MSHHEKLENARFHLGRLDEELGKFLKSDPYTLIRHEQRTPEKHALSYTLSVKHHPSHGVSLIIGDCLYNLRSALDHLTFALAPKPGASRNLTQVQFPIYDSVESFDEKSERRIGHLPDEIRAVFRRFQPDTGGHRLHTHPLWLLNELGNEDKHRYLVLATGVDTDWGMGHGTIIKDVLMRSTTGSVDGSAFKDGDEVARFEFTVIGPNPKVNLNLKATFAITLSQEGPARGAPLAETFERCFNHIRKSVFPAFKEFL